MWAIEINWDGVWLRVPVTYEKRDDAEWRIAKWREAHGSNGQDTGLRAVPGGPRRDVIAGDRT